MEAAHDLVLLETINQQIEKRDVLLRLTLLHDVLYRASLPGSMVGRPEAAVDAQSSDNQSRVALETQRLVTPPESPGARSSEAPLKRKRRTSHSPHRYGKSPTHASGRSQLRRLERTHSEAPQRRQRLAPAATIALSAASAGLAYWQTR